MPRLAEVMQRLQREGRIWKSQIDTDEREVERNGSVDGIRCAERVFSADRDAVVSILSALMEDPASDERLAIAMIGVDRMLADCGLELAGRLRAVENQRDLVQRELRLHPRAKRRLDEKFRAERASLDAALESRDSSNRSSLLLAADLAFARWSEAMTPIVNELRELRRQGRLYRDISDTVLSYAHMHVNRLMPTDPRAHELHVYDFLARRYRSSLATTMRSIT